MSNTKERMTSIELLRVISMIMIIAYHWQLHGNHDGIIYSMINPKQVFSFAFGSWGTLGVDIFFIISSYFLQKSKEVKLKSILTVIIKASLYGTVVLLVANILGITEFSATETVRALLGILAYQYWFLTVYAVVFLIHPILNRIINSLPKKYFTVALIVMVYCSYVLGFVIVNEFIGRLSCGIVIYLLIGYLERFPEMNNFRKHRFLFSCGGYAALLLVECCLSTLGTYRQPIFFSVIKRLQITQSPFMLVIACAVFYDTLSLRMNQNRIIGFLGKYSVGAYLLHGGSSFIKNYLWDGLFQAGRYYCEETVLAYILHYILCVAMLFAAGVLIEFCVDSCLNAVLKPLSKCRLRLEDE